MKTVRCLQSWTIALLVLVVATGVQGAEDAGKRKGKLKIKKRVAVLGFEDKTDGSHKWWNQKSVGEGLSDMLITALAKSGRYRVVERQELDAVIQEQQLGGAGLATEETAAKVGRLLSVEMLVMGAVTEFGQEKSDVGGSTKRFGLGLSKSSVTVAVDVRFVNSNTGEIVAAESVRKSKGKSGISFSSSEVDFGNENEFDRSLVGKVAREAVDGVIKFVDRHMASVPWQGKVVKGNGQVYINAGSEIGIRVGDRFTVYRPGEELIDPDTGISLGTTESRVGVIEVVKNDLGQGKASVCKAVSGSGFQRGDIVREK